MNTTYNYGFKKPEYTDAADIHILNENADKIDNLIKENEESSLKQTQAVNDPEVVAEAIGVARSYYNARLISEGVYRFVYGYDTCLSDKYWQKGTPKNEIDCSTFVGLVLRGVPFEKSPYNAYSTYSDHYIYPNTKDFSWAFDPFGFKSIKDPDKDTEKSPARTAAQLAEMFGFFGRIVDFKPDFSNVEVGDIVFYAKKNNDGTWKEPYRFKHISHLAFVHKKTPNAAGADYPYSHKIYDATANEQVIRDVTMENAAYSPERICFVVRPYYGVYHGKKASYTLSDLGSETNLNTVFDSGNYYLTSSITQGLPTGIANGLYYQLKVERTYTATGKPYAIMQTLIEAKENCNIYVRSQYCAGNDRNYIPDADYWTAWKKITTTAVT